MKYGRKKKIIFIFSFFFKNFTSLGPNWSILLGSWKGQIEKKFQSRIHRGQFRFWMGRNGTCPARFGSNSPKRTLMGQTGPREIGANLAFGVNLALFILQCRCFTVNHTMRMLPFHQHYSNPFVIISSNRVLLRRNKVTLTKGSNY